MFNCFFLPVDCQCLRSQPRWTWLRTSDLTFDNTILDCAQLMQNALGALQRVPHLMMMMMMNL